MKSSIRLASSGGNSAISRKLGTCRSGMTSKCVRAWGLMSRIATRPSVAATWSPSRTSLQKRQSGSGSMDPLLRHGRGAHADERANRQIVVDEPGRVIVAVAAADTVDEHVVLALELRAPVREARGVRRRTHAGAALLLLRVRHGIGLRRDGARPRRV